MPYHPPTTGNGPHQTAAPGATEAGEGQTCAGHGAHDSDPGRYRVREGKGEPASDEDATTARIEIPTADERARTDGNRAKPPTAAAGRAASAHRRPRRRRIPPPFRSAHSPRITPASTTPTGPGGPALREDATTGRFDLDSVGSRAREAEPAAPRIASSRRVPPPPDTAARRARASLLRGAMPLAVALGGLFGFAVAHGLAGRWAETSSDPASPQPVLVELRAPDAEPPPTAPAEAATAGTERTATR